MYSFGHNRSFQSFHNGKIKTCRNLFQIFYTSLYRDNEYTIFVGKCNGDDKCPRREYFNRTETNPTNIVQELERT